MSRRRDDFGISPYGSCLFLVVIVFPFDLPNGLRFSRGASPVAPSADGCKRR